MFTSLILGLQRDIENQEQENTFLIKMVRTWRELQDMLVWIRI